jgi:hypothetical protein
MATKLPELRNEAFIQKMNEFLTEEEKSCMTLYVESGGLPLSANLAGGLYELFLNGSSCMEILKLNKGLAYGAIIDARIRYEWDKNKEEYAYELHSKIREKVIKAQLQTTELLSNILFVAGKKNNAKLQKYLQTGDESHLEGALNIENLTALTRITENLMKITGQDKIASKDDKKLVDLSSATSNSPRIAGGKQSDVDNSKDKGSLSPEDAAAVLKIISDSKRSK